MKRAMFVGTVDIGAGDAILYKLSDPLQFGDNSTSDVVVSAVTAPPHGKRATVFPADEQGKILSFSAIAEVKDTLDHEAPLNKLGYEIL